MATNNKIVPFDTQSFRQFVNEFSSESDRAAVVLGAAKLDLVLYQLLQAFLLPSGHGKDELLDGDSALGTFSAKINIAHRLGLIDAAYARSLHMVRKIRNAFAHEVSGCSLTIGAHSDRVRELSLPFRHFGFYPILKNEFFPDKEGSGADFRTTLAIMVVRLEKLLVGIEMITNYQMKPLVVRHANVCTVFGRGRSAMQ